MDCSIPGFPVHHQLPELTNSCQLSRRCHPTISSSVIPFSSCLQSFPASRSFLISQFFASGGQSIGVSASTSVLPMNIQDWFPLGWTGWISLQSKGLSKVFSTTTVQSINYLVLSFLYGTTLISIHDHWKNHSFDYTEFCQQSDVSARFFIAFLSRSIHLLSILFNVPLYGYNEFVYPICLSILFMVDIWIIYSLRLLQIRLLWTFVSLCEHMLSVLLGN